MDSEKAIKGDIMEFIISLIFLAIYIGIIYLLVRQYLSKSFFINRISNTYVKEITRWLFLFIITALIGGIILITYSDFGIENNIFLNLGKLVAIVFTAWLARVDYYLNQKKESEEVYFDKSSKFLIYSAAGLFVLPIIVNLILK